MKTQNDPEEVIREIHALAGMHGYERTRIDRSQYADAWIEVGFSNFDQITIRDSTGGIRRFNVDRYDAHETLGLLNLLKMKGSNE